MKILVTCGIASAVLTFLALVLDVITPAAGLLAVSYCCAFKVTFP